MIYSAEFIKTHANLVQASKVKRNFKFFILESDQVFEFKMLKPKALFEQSNAEILSKGGYHGHPQGKIIELSRNQEVYFLDFSQASALLPGDTFVKSSHPKNKCICIKSHRGKISARIFHSPYSDEVGKIILLKPDDSIEFYPVSPPEINGVKKNTVFIIVDEKCPVFSNSYPLFWITNPTIEINTVEISAYPQKSSKSISIDKTTQILPFKNLKTK